MYIKYNIYGILYIKQCEKWYQLFRINPLHHICQCRFSLKVSVSKNFLCKALIIARRSLAAVNKLILLFIEVCHLQSTGVSMKAVLYQRSEIICSFGDYVDHMIALWREGDFRQRLIPTVISSAPTVHNQWLALLIRKQYLTGNLLMAKNIIFARKVNLCVRRLRALLSCKSVGQHH